jgi:hypothetical protein
MSVASLHVEPRRWFATVVPVKSSIGSLPTGRMFRSGRLIKAATAFLANIDDFPPQCAENPPNLGGTRWTIELASRDVLTIAGASTTTLMVIAGSANVPAWRIVCNLAQYSGHATRACRERFRERNHLDELGD